MDLYAQYIEETTGRNCVYDEYSFYTYTLDDNMIYLDNVYISKENRGSGKAEEIVEEVYSLGKKNGCKTMTSSICKNYFEKVQERSEHMLKKLGFDKYDENENMVYYYKEIK